MQHCHHVATFYWYRYNAIGVPASQRNAYYAMQNEYRQASGNAAFAKRWFRY